MIVNSGITARGGNLAHIRIASATCSGSRAMANISGVGLTGRFSKTQPHLVFAQDRLRQSNRFLTAFEVLLKGLKGVEFLIAALRHRAMQRYQTSRFSNLARRVKSREFALIARRWEVRHSSHVVAFQSFPEILYFLCIGGLEARLHHAQTKLVAVFNEMEWLPSLTGRSRSHRKTGRRAAQVPATF